MSETQPQIVDPFGTLLNAGAYRVNGGVLKLGYKLIERPENVLQDALGAIAGRLGEQFPSVFIGEPGTLA